MYGREILIVFVCRTYRTSWQLATNTSDDHVGGPNRITISDEYSSSSTSVSFVVGDRSG
jgi:hypothetical protein